MLLSLLFYVSAWCYNTNILCILDSTQLFMYMEELVRRSGVSMEELISLANESKFKNIFIIIIFVLYFLLS